MSELIINDDNYNSFITFEDRGRGMIERRWDLVPEGKFEYAAAVPIRLIPRSEWPDRIRQMERDKSRLSDIFKDSKIKVKDQQQTNYCHANSPATAMEIIREVQGQPYVELSPGSIGGPVTNYRNAGAWIGDNLKHIYTKGVASTAFVPLNQISRSGWKPGADENAAEHICTEWVEIPRGRISFDYVMTLVLSRIPVCTAHNWWRHAVTALDPFMSPDGRSFGTRDVNSWGERYGDGGFFVLMEGKGTPDEAYSPASTLLHRT
jgi:hypothetical protein